MKTLKIQMLQFGTLLALTLTSTAAMAKQTCFVNNGGEAVEMPVVGKNKFAHTDRDNTALQIEFQSYEINALFLGKESSNAVIIAEKGSLSYYANGRELTIINGKQRLLSVICNNTSP